MLSLVGGAVLRLAFVPTHGFVTDVGTFVAWAERLREVGPLEFYAPGYFADYPPAHLLVLWGAASLVGGMPAALAKALSIPFDLAIALALWAVLRRVVDGEMRPQGEGPLCAKRGRASPKRGGAGEGLRPAAPPPLGRAGPSERAGVVAAALYLFNPALVLAGPYWGQVDSVGALPFLLAVIAAAFGRFGVAGVLAGVALMVKPQFGLALVAVLAAAAVELRERRAQPLALAVLGAVASVVLLGLPFKLSPVGLAQLVLSAAGTYEYTSLYAFNVWAIFGDFWQPDAQRFLGLTYQLWSTLLFALGLVGAFVFLWREAPCRWGALDRKHGLGVLLAFATLLVLAFYFLPTRVHERYLFPAFALLAPFAALRTRHLVLYLALSAFFLLSVFYAFTRYPETQTRAPDFLEATVYQRPGVILLSLVGIVAAALLAWSWWRRREHDLVPEPTIERHAVPAALPTALAVGARPTRRDLAAALLLALAVVLTRGVRLDWPRDMYFDEVYHARTAMELLAGREPYEWTHPHLAKELMAASILLFGDVRAVARGSDVPAEAVAYAASGDGWRAWALPDGTLRFDDGSGKPRDVTRVSGLVALAVEGRRLVVATTRELLEIPVDHSAAPARVTLPSPARALSVSGDQIAVATSDAVLLYRGLDRPPELSLAVRDAIALQLAPDRAALYVASADGAAQQIRLGQSEGHLPGETERSYQAEGPVSAMVVVPGASRLFLADANEPVLTSVDLESGALERVSLENARTAPFRGPIAGLAASPRARLVWALGPDGVVAVEPHGVSAFAVVREAAGARALIVDDARDRVVAALGVSPVEVSSGRVAFAWRFPGVLAAGALAFFLYLLARRLFASRVVAALLGALVVLDGSMFAQARIGMNDIYVAAAIVAGWYFVVAALQSPRRAWLDLVLAGVTFGVGLAAKWAAGPAILAVGLVSLAVTARALWARRPGTGGPLDLLAWRGRNAVFLAASFVVLPLAIYLASYVPWFGLGHQLLEARDGRWSFVELQRQMYGYHANLTAPHPAGSPWWAWPLDLKPVYWEYEPATAQPNLALDALNQAAAALVRVPAEASRATYIYDAGNLVLWWAGIPAMAYVLAQAARVRAWHLVVLSVAFLTQYVAWIPVSRVLFQYHFFTALPFYLLALAAALAVWWERAERRRWVQALLVGAAVWFVWFYPWLSALPVPGTLSSFYYWWPTWQYGCQFYPSFRCG